ncbi:neugrin isoform X1 [Ranitomeya variabilis]|uniref:neugrin isoform X1 n=1 Tax=Ranitomeya variabilis TaxID=490064 RepID=UPI004057C9F4
MIPKASDHCPPNSHRKAHPHPDPTPPRSALYRLSLPGPGNGSQSNSDGSNRCSVMAASLVAAMWRLRILGASHCSPLGYRGLRTRHPGNPFPVDVQEPESDGESEENVEQELKSALKRHQRAIRLKRLKKELEPPEPAERRLTWNAIQQIRYLRQELPEEWPLTRLAIGFNVSTDAIKKVLKSKFTPNEARRMKQDASVFRILGQNLPVSSKKQLQLEASSKHPAQPLLPLQGNKRQLLISQSAHLLPPPTPSDSSELALRTEHLTKSLTPESQDLVQGVFSAASSQGGPATSTKVESDQTMNKEERTEDEKWDREVLSDKDLEELANSGAPNNMKVVQKGKEFFDSDGNFLYRI